MIENEVTRDLLQPKMLRVWILIFAAPILLVCVTTVAIVIMVRTAGGDQSVIPQGLMEWFPYIVMVNHTLLFLVTVWFVRIDGLSLSSIGWKQTRHAWPFAIVIGLAAGIAIYLVQAYACEPLVYSIRDAFGMGNLRSSSTPTAQANLLGLVTATFFAGVAEETVYRGYIQRQLVLRHGAWIGILVSNLAFTVGLHWGFGPWGLIVVFVNGLLLALLYQWRQNLLTNAIAHSMINLLVLLL